MASEISAKCSVDRVRQGFGYEGIGGPIKRAQLRFRYVLIPFLLSGLHEYSTWLRGGIGLLKSIRSVALIVFGRDLIEEESASKSSVLDFVFATCCWRSGCIEVQIAHFDRE